MLERCGLGDWRFGFGDGWGRQEGWTYEEVIVAGTGHDGRCRGEVVGVG